MRATTPLTTGAAALVPFIKGAPTLAVKALEIGQALEPIGPGLLPDSTHIAICIRLQFQGGADGCVAAFLIPNSTEAKAGEFLLRLALLADIPLDYQAQRNTQQPKAEAEKFASVLDVLSQVNAEGRFLAALMALAFRQPPVCRQWGRHCASSCP